MRQARGGRTLPVIMVNPHRFAGLATVESDEDSDDEWIDEHAVRVRVTA